MTDDKSYRWSAKPESLEAKFKLMCLLPHDSRVKRRHMLVFGFILDWYHSGYGNALASVRHIDAQLKARDPAGAGLYSGQIHGALTDLVDWGYLNRIRDRGRRAFRYIPTWSVLELSVLENVNANSVRENENTSVRETENATASCVRDSVNEDPLTRPGPQDPGTCSDISSRPMPDAAEGAARAGEDFDALATAYAKPGDNLVKARLAFLDITPDEAELARMVKAAASWRASAKGSRMSLERWLKEKRWLKTEEFKQDNRPSHPWPCCFITKIKPASEKDDYTAKIWFKDRDGASRMQVLSSGEFRSLQEACAVDKRSVEDPSDDMHEFVGARFDLGEGGWFEPISTRRAA